MTRIKDALDAVAAAVIAQKDYLTSLDAKIGDGDHGLNMARGFRAAQEAVEEMDDTTLPGPVLKTIGKALIQNVGGAAGPLYGAGFVSAGEACDGDTHMNVASIEKLLSAAIAAIQKRGRAAQGDKTMLDTLIPVRDCFLPENAQDKPLFEVLQDASRAAGEGVNYTKTIAARKGRASLVGERSIGIEDPGAVSSMVMYRALYQFLKN
ncbi:MULTISPECIES: dihydroxyacetone kinase subunit DhaL [Selenomonas]|uniref:phosphoenolpyruvate--glycerone phosphotransferase n=1 Tax=Selenomonas ruminis TaxID=2593411 RepID=A0A5D6W642_9FIRM|nr:MULTISPECIES: dihydroxyacetone kinase subunit DhaL [unclassified Selenomonas]MBQ1867823.1 dihydroxyacetone kinase subunit L [Selenomonas sp.]TYZ23921.1 dihydroxyacetone kinase subunit L [Selenomonas sp. mPRGC5]